MYLTQYPKESNIDIDITNIIGELTTLPEKGRKVCVFLLLRLLSSETPTDFTRVNYGVVAQETGVSYRQVQRIISDAVKWGWFKYRRSRSNHKNKGKSTKGCTLVDLALTEAFLAGKVLVQKRPRGRPKTA